AVAGCPESCGRGSHPAIQVPEGDSCHESDCCLVPPEQPPGGLYRCAGLSGQSLPAHGHGAVASQWHGTEVPRPGTGRHSGFAVTGLPETGRGNGTTRCCCPAGSERDSGTIGWTAFPGCPGAV